jgi:RimJ/RimL family protein N-acetyltransferase
VGQVVSVPFDDGGSIGYIGVVPEQRGHGYIHDLLAAGVALIRDSGLNSVVCDTDSLNAPMHHAFERMGFAHTGTVWVYHGDIAPLIG